jgi:hypothetical protein
MDMIKNPLAIGAIAGIVTYVLIYAKQKYYDGKDKPIVQLHIPLIIALIAWFSSSNMAELGTCYDPGYDVTETNGNMLSNERIFGDLANFG